VFPQFALRAHGEPDAFAMHADFLDKTAGGKIFPREARSGLKPAYA